MLTKPIRSSYSIAPAIISNETKLNAFVGDDLIVCGFGSINNQNVKSRTLKCTNIRAVPVEDCVEAMGENWPTNG